MIEEKILTKKDVFHLYELFLIAEAIGSESIFGLPDKSIYAITEPSYLETAKVALQEKGILDEYGKISKGGFFVFKALKEYTNSRKYVQINNLMIAISASEPDERIVLTEIEHQRYYQLKVMDKLLVLKDLFYSLPLVEREPLAEEKEFTLKKFRNRERRSILEKEIGEDVLALAIFDTDEEQLAKGLIDWLYFIEDEKLCGVNLEDKSYYHVSQYWLMKELFDSLEIPYSQKSEKEEGE